MSDQKQNTDGIISTYLKYPYNPQGECLLERLGIDPSYAKTHQQKLKELNDELIEINKTTSVTSINEKGENDLDLLPLQKKLEEAICNKLNSHDFMLYAMRLILQKSVEHRATIQVKEEMEERKEELKNSVEDLIKLLINNRKNK